MLSWDDKRKILNSAVSLLENAMPIFHAKLGQPHFINEEGRERFEYTEHTSLHFQFLKAVRIISGLNAIMCLLEKGYTQEIGVLTRTIYDFIDEIEYVREAHCTGKPTAGQQKIIDDFFQSTLQTGEELMEKPDKQSRVTKREIIASMGRLARDFCNPDRMQKLNQATHSLYSRYVHGAYSTIMTLCEGCGDLYGNIKARFRLKGMLDTPQIHSYRYMVAGLIHRSLNEFGFLALDFGFTDLKEKFINKRKEIEDKDIYNPGPIQDKSGNKGDGAESRP